MCDKENNNEWKIENSFRGLLALAHCQSDLKSKHRTDLNCSGTIQLNSCYLVQSAVQETTLKRSSERLG